MCSRPVDRRSPISSPAVGLPDGRSLVDDDGRRRPVGRSPRRMESVIFRKFPRTRLDQSVAPVPSTPRSAIGGWRFLPRPLSDSSPRADRNISPFGLLKTHSNPRPPSSARSGPADHGIHKPPRPVVHPSPPSRLLVPVVRVHRLVTDEPIVPTRSPGGRWPDPGFRHRRTNPPTVRLEIDGGTIHNDRRDR